MVQRIKVAPAETWSRHAALYESESTRITLKAAADELTDRVAITSNIPIAIIFLFIKVYYKKNVRNSTMCFSINYFNYNLEFF